MSAAGTPQFALAAAHGITPRVAATWHPFLRRTPRVLVPVHLEALMVRQAGGAWARTGMATPTADTPDLAKLLPKPFLNLDPPRPRGAYLHWALPDALTRGVANASDQTATFPTVPDRWLVLRLYPSKTANRRTVRGWILQTGDAHPAPLDLDGWKEPGAPPANVQQPLTALGHGDLSWSAYYDNVVNRMGFYDSLADAPRGPLAYLVCGWFSDQSHDPLGDTGIRSLADFEAKLGQLQWSLPDNQFHAAAAQNRRYVELAAQAGLASQLSAQDQQRATVAFDARPFVKTGPGSAPEGPPYVSDGSWWPQDTLYHGSALGIGWPGNDQGALPAEPGGPPAPGQINVALANTLGEALALAVAHANGKIGEARVLEAFQLGVLAELNQPDGQARLDALLHLSGFGSLPGGATTERLWQPPSGPPPTGPANPPKPDPGVFARFEHPSLAKARTSAATLKGKVGGQAESRVFQARSFAQENSLLAGSMAAAVGAVKPQAVEPFEPGKWVDVERALPRFFHPMDPVVLMQGLRRSFQYGGDGRFNEDGTLSCRLSGACAHSYSRSAGDLAWPAIHPEDVLDRGVENGSAPPECEELLGELAVLDPGSSAPMVEAATAGLPIPPARKAAEAQHVMAEQTAWWALRDPRVDHGPLLAKLNFAGVLPSPVAVGLPSQPWSPVHLEWRVEFTPSPGKTGDWELGEVDYNESVPALPPAGAHGALTLEGRSPLSAGATRTAADAVRQAIRQIAAAGGAAQLPPNGVEQFTSALSARLLTTVNALRFQAAPAPGGIDRSALEDIAKGLESMDVLSGSFNGLHQQLRGGFESDGVSAPNPGDPAPPLFFTMRAGFLRVLRLRLVDGFGQFLELAGSSATTPADPAGLLRSGPLEVTGRPDLLALPPRFTAPGRWWFRLVDAQGTGQEASLATDVAPAVSPVCGYLMPNHLDAALAFFGVDGAGLGAVRPADDGGVLWEDTPGQPSTVGQSPARAVPNPYLAGIGEGLIRWGMTDAGLEPGRDTALQGLLRVIDSTLWSIDPFGHQGDEHLALLVGHPVAVMRAVLRLELREPVDPGAANLERLPVRLGALAHWQDGLFGYFVNDDYTKLYCSDAAQAGMARSIGPGQGFLQQANLTQDYYNRFGADLAAGQDTGQTPVEHPYIDSSGVLYVHPNQDVHLTLLVEPHTLVHATSGILPRKEIGMRREWVQEALAKMAPTFRFGPVLVDPRRIRMPIAAELNGAWSWDHRRDISAWVNDPVTHATGDAILGPDPPTASEGWLRLGPPEGTAQP